MKEEYITIATLVQKACNSHLYMPLASELSDARDFMYNNTSLITDKVYIHLDKATIGKLETNDYYDLEKLCKSALKRGEYNLWNRLSKAHASLRKELNNMWTNDLLKNIEIYDF